MSGIDSKPRRRWWLVFTVCSLAVVAGLLWITVEVLHLEKREERARAEAVHQESLRLALWRMDSWFAPRLAREAARQVFDYDAFYPQQQAYTKLLSEIESGEVLVRSPLLSFRSPYIRLHFRTTPSGRLSSPQAPTGNFRDRAEGVAIDGATITANLAMLATIRELMPVKDLATCVAAAESQVTQLAFDSAALPGLPAPEASQAPGAPYAELQQERSQREWITRRQQTIEQQIDNVAAPSLVDASGAGVSVGPLVPIWTAAGHGGADGELMFLRRVRDRDGEYLQGFLCDWSRLQTTLIGLVADLIPAGRLVPARTVDGQTLSGTMLATIPAALEAPSPVVAATAGFTPTRATLLVTWLAVCCGLAAVAVTLRSSIAYAEKRSRFASAVTHELRTPLTTFRMYSEMLATGMVRDEAQRAAYLQTLRDESDRLATLVENVLAYARLERGRASDGDVREITFGGLIEHVRPALERTARAAGMDLAIAVDGAPDASIRLDVEAVSQILHNLVENAGKYARDAEDRTIHVEATLADGRLGMDVIDHGPGIDGPHVRSIFLPFHRGSRETGDATPGVGLGLALARGLARRLGGELRLMTTSVNGQARASARRPLPSLAPGRLRKLGTLTLFPRLDVRLFSTGFEKGKRPQFPVHCAAMPDTKTRSKKSKHPPKVMTDSEVTWRTAKSSDRHELYELSVQEPEAECDLIEQVWQEQRGRRCLSIREDFCGTATVCMEWVKRRRDHTAVGVDLDAEVLKWGSDRIPRRLNREQSSRITLIRDNVLTVETEKVDSVLAMNFSYFLFKTRPEVVSYFERARSALKDDGLLLLDAYGGSDSFLEMEEDRDLDGFTYIWDQHSYNPITGHAVNFIHFTFPDGSEMRNAFRYEWRLWTLPEIREMLLEAGFRDVVVYWEGTDEETEEGDGEWSVSMEGEACPGWIAYLVGIK